MRINPKKRELFKAYFAYYHRGESKDLVARRFGYSKYLLMKGLKEHSVYFHMVLDNKKALFLQGIRITDELYE